MQKLKVIWERLALNYITNRELIHAFWAEIEYCYNAPGRCYHNLVHIAYMIDKAYQFKDELMDFDTILFSIFYHDIIYVRGRQDNEQKSAERAVERLTNLGVPGAKTEKCQQQIQATQTHADIQDNDTAYLLDFDLSILGETTDKYREYAHQIRKEYSDYPDADYAVGRKMVINHFLEMERIFKTNSLYNLYEQNARKNLNLELKRLH